MFMYEIWPSNLATLTDTRAVCQLCTCVGDEAASRMAGQQHLPMRRPNHDGMSKCTTKLKSRVVMFECSCSFLTCARFWPAFSTTGPRYDILRGDSCPHYGAVAELLLFDVPPLSRPRHEPFLGSPRRCPTGSSNSYPRVSSVHQSCLLFSCLAAIMSLSTPSAFWRWTTCCSKAAVKMP